MLRRTFLGSLLAPFGLGVGPAFGQTTPTGTNSSPGIVSGGAAGGNLTGTFPNPGVAFVTGTTSGTAAAAGNVGEYTTASIASSAAVALVTTGTVTSIVGVNLNPGDWDVWGSGFFFAANTASAWKSMAIAVNNSSTAFPANPSGGFSNLQLSSSGVTSLATTILGVTPVQFISSAAVTAYLVAQALASAGVGSCVAYGIIQARRRA